VAALAAGSNVDATTSSTLVAVSEALFHPSRYEIHEIHVASADGAHTGEPSVAAMQSECTAHSDFADPLVAAPSGTVSQAPLVLLALLARQPAGVAPAVIEFIRSTDKVTVGTAA